MGTALDWEKVMKNENFRNNLGRSIADCRVMWYSTSSKCNYKKLERKEINLLICLTVKYHAVCWHKISKGLKNGRQDLYCLRIWKKNFIPRLIDEKNSRYGAQAPPDSSFKNTSLLYYKPNIFSRGFVLDALKRNCKFIVSESRRSKKKQTGI